MTPNPSLNQEEPFDFSQYSVKDSQYLPQVASQEIRPVEPFDFSQYYIKEPVSQGSEIGRHVARTGSRVAESVLGFPGDVVNFVKFLGEKLPKGPSFLQKEPNIVQKAGRELLGKLPSSEELKEYSGRLTSGFTDPQSAQEELGDEITSLATVLVSPSKALGGFKSFLKTLGGSVAKAGATKGSGEVAELFGADTSTKNKVELGTLLMTGFIAPKMAEKFIGEQYQQARSKIPQGVMLNTSQLASDLLKVDQELAKGISTPTKNEVRSALRELEAKASGGAMEAQELVESYHNLNERMNSKKLFDELNTTERKVLRNRYDLVKDKVSSEIASYGKSNPEFYNAWKGANEGFATLSKSKNVSNFLKSKTGSMPKHLLGSIAFDLFTGHPAAIPSVVGGYSLLKGGELLYRISKSPTLRDHYLKVIMEAGNENLPGVIKHLNALDEEVKKIKN